MSLFQERSLNSYNTGGQAKLSTKASHQNLKAAVMNTQIPKLSGGHNKAKSHIPPNQFQTVHFAQTKNREKENSTV